MKVTFTRQNEAGVPVLVEVNLDLGTVADDMVWMLWAFAPLQSDNGAGEISREERERLSRLVADLEAGLELSHGAEYAGMRLQDGWAEIYFYAVFSKGAEKRFRQSFLEHGYAQIEFGANRDGRHDFYREQLYPDAFEMQQASSRQIIAELEAAGDDLDKARPVEHYLFFQTPAAMQRTAQVLSDRGEVQSGLKESGEFPHGLMIKLVHACTIDAVTSATRPLIEAALDAHGTYLGWSTVLADTCGVEDAPSE